MEKLLSRLFRQYGSELFLYTGGAWVPFRGFLQAVTNRGSNHYLKEVSPVGEIPPGTYVYFGPAAVAVEEGSLIKKDGQVYRLCRAEAMSDARGPAYEWGLCVREGGEDIWGQS